MIRNLNFFRKTMQTLPTKAAETPIAPAEEWYMGVAQ